MWLLSDLPNLGLRHCRAAVLHDRGCWRPTLLTQDARADVLLSKLRIMSETQALIDIYYGIGADHMGQEAWDAECKRRIKALQETPPNETCAGPPSSWAFSSPSMATPSGWTASPFASWGLTRPRPSTPCATASMKGARGQEAA